MHISETHRLLKAVESNARTLAELVGNGTTTIGDPAMIERLRAQVAKDFAIVNTELGSAPEAA